MARSVRRQALKSPLPAGPVDIHFYPRTYQLAAWDALTEAKVKRAMLIWPRGVGKDLLALHILLYWMAHWPGQYFHVFPTYGQGKRGIWEASYEVHGKTVRYLDLFPPALMDGPPSETELQIRLKPIPPHTVGSIYQIIGADNADSIRGTHPNGAVLSEIRDMKPEVWNEVVEPALMSHDGFAIFISTPRGKNHLYKMYNAALRDPHWFVQHYQCTQLYRDAIGEDGRRVYTDEDVARYRVGKDEATVQQELFCSWEGYQQGSILAEVLRAARADGRIAKEPYEVSLPVGVALDFGRDGTAMWFYQVAGRQVRVIDYAAFRGKGIDHAFKLLRDRKPYLYGRFVLPFDAAHERFTDAPTVAEAFEAMWPGMVQVVDRVPIDSRIDMLRRKFSTLYFDEVKCSREQEDQMPSGLDSLEGWRRTWDDKKQDFGQAPVHDAFSHGADALTYAAVDDFAKPEWLRPEDLRVSDCVTKFNVFTHGHGPALIGR